MTDNYPQDPSANLPGGIDLSADYERPGQVAQGGGGAPHPTVNQVNADAQAGLVFLDASRNGLDPMHSMGPNHDNRVVEAQAGLPWLSPGDGAGPPPDQKFGLAFDPRKRREVAGPG